MIDYCDKTIIFLLFSEVILAYPHDDGDDDSLRSISRLIFGNVKWVFVRPTNQMLTALCYFFFNYKSLFLLLSSRYQIAEESFTEPVPTTTYPSPTYVAAPATTTTTTTASTILQSNIIAANLPALNSSAKTSKKGSIIFPSVKNKPSVINTTFTADAVPFKDVKVWRFLTFSDFLKPVTLS